MLQLEVRNVGLSVAIFLPLEENRGNYRADCEASQEQRHWFLLFGNLLQS